MKDFVTRGVIYIAISLLGLIYLFAFAERAETLPVVVFCALMGIGMYCVFGIGRWRT
ncbi:MAG: hypothetical protein ONB17_06410 [candidate division KSB1 bacterium]|nr:hypothetical protein [candidate division KSB1 bacterium]MDZ7294979.1 hypothetical protein [candidate division KSB1 bacterium]MDZ7384907.1 hypothetical protein [candidate division KSB1 bacterium]MDZ7391961.1 hypothetical protein [candidate division KSB1 bacterium]MDZ7412036.1 hypothetical protein [candidate division KSB1 bacterium]